MADSHSAARDSSRSIVKPRCSSIVRAADNSVWSILYSRLSSNDFEVVAVATVREALTHGYRILWATAFRPAHAGDGFTVVSAMPYTHPEAMALVLSGYPEMDEALAAIRLWTAEVLVTM